MTATRRKATEDQHWLYKWMDEFEVDHCNVDVVFRSPTAVRRLFDLTAAAVSAEKKPIDPSKDAVVAGRTLDINGPYTCSKFVCTQQRIDRTFLSTWHYFDSIVVSGPSERAIAKAIATTKKADRAKNLIGPLAEDVALFSYLRHIGAADHVTFRTKEFSLCECCFEKEAQRVGLSAILDKEARERVVQSMLRDADIGLRLLYPGAWAAELDHDSLPERLVWGIKSRKKPTKRQVIEEFIHQGAGGMLEDFYQSSELKLPLLQEVRPSLFGKEDAAVKSAGESVALALDLPYLEGATAADVLAFMSDERPAFDRFKSAIRKSIQEKVEKAGDESPDVTARRVIKEYVQPSLAEIDASLASARKLLAKKSAVGVGVGAVVATVGVLTAMPLIIGAGVTAAASPLLDAKKYLEDRSTLESKDMYFLWQMQKSLKVTH